MKEAYSRPENRLEVAAIHTNANGTGTEHEIEADHRSPPLVLGNVIIHILRSFLV